MKLVSSDEFWEYMCSPYFRRVGTLQGVHKGELIVTCEAPGSRPDFWKSRINETMGLLCGKTD